MKEIVKSSMMNYIYPFDMLPSNNFFRPARVLPIQEYAPLQEVKPPFQDDISFRHLRPHFFHKPRIDTHSISKEETPTLDKTHVEADDSNHKKEVPSFDIETRRFRRLEHQLIIDLINNLHLSKLSIYKQTKMVQNTEHIFYIKKRDSIEQHYLIIEVAKEKVNFIDVSYDGVLLQHTFIEDVSPCFPIVFKSKISMYFRGQLYQTVYNVPFLQPLAKIKESIISLFTFPSKTFLLFGRLLLHFTLLDNVMNLTFMGFLENNLFKALTHWDWCQGTLVGKHNHEIQYIWNDCFFKNTNQFPSIEGGSLVLIGGLYNYQVEKTERRLIQATYGGISSFFLDELEGGQISYVSLKRNIQVKDDKSKYILSFSNVRNDPMYALIGHTSFVNSVRTILSFPIRVFFTDTKTEQFQDESTFSFLLCSTKLFIYQKKGFYEYVEKYKGNIDVSDLYLTNLNQNKDYSVEMNQLVPSCKTNGKIY